MNAHLNDRLPETPLGGNPPEICPVVKTDNRRPFLTFFILVIVVFVSLNQLASAEDRAAFTTCKGLGYPDEVMCLKAVLENDPCDLEAFLTLTWLMAENDDWEELMSLLTHLSNTSPDTPHFFQMRAKILAEHYRDLAAAEIELNKAEGLERCLGSKEEEILKPIPPIPENAERILERANTRYQYFRDYGGAARDLETYISLVQRPNSPSVFRHLAGARRQLGDIPGAIDALSRQMTIFPETAISALPTRARLYREMGDEASARADMAELQQIEFVHHQKAIARLDERIAGSPADVSAYIERGMLKLKIGDYNGAIGDANRILELDPDFAAAYELRAKARTELGNLEGARADRERSFELLREARE